jgi:hypothetical protein
MTTGKVVLRCSILWSAILGIRLLKSGPKKVEERKMKTDTELVDWLCDHATVIGIIKHNGESEYIKVEGENESFRDLILQRIKEEEKEKNGK